MLTQSKEQLLSMAMDNLTEANYEPHDIAIDRLIDAISQVIIVLKMEKDNDN